MSRIIRRTLRAWWPELIWVVLLTLMAFSGDGYPPLASMVIGVFGAIFWAMGFRHRRTPLHDKVDRITETVGEVKDILTDGAPPAGKRPGLAVLKGGRS